MLSNTLTRVAVIGDLVASREAQDRPHLQRTLRAVLATVNGRWGAVDPFTETVGDEFQAVYDNLFVALDATMLIRAMLPPPYDARFGIGVGDISFFGRSSTTGLRHQDGPAWWAARQAIDHVGSAVTRREVPTLRTWVWAHPERRVRVHADVALPSDDEPNWLAPVNAYLTLRDHLVSMMDERDRRILGKKLSLDDPDMHEIELQRAGDRLPISPLAQRSRRIADEERVSPSAISQRIRRSGVAEILYSRDLLLMFLAPFREGMEP